jgi:hypothetical protein
VSRACLETPPEILSKRCSPSHETIRLSFKKRMGNARGKSWILCIRIIILGRGLSEKCKVI